MWTSGPLRATARRLNAELRRVAPLIQEGGYVPMLDHSAPPDIPYKNYCHFMQELPRYL